MKILVSCPECGKEIDLIKVIQAEADKSKIAESLGAVAK